MKVKTRNIIYLFCITLILACLTGCQENNVQTEETTALTPETVQEGNEEVRIEKDVVSITLNENATTGFTWSYVCEPEDMMAFDGEEYIQAETDEKLVGAGCLHMFVFKAQKAGEVSLTFNYARSWEDVEPIETKTYNFIIDEQLNIKTE